MEPIFPPEIERPIFTHAAQTDHTCIYSLMRVARRVRLWVEPHLYDPVVVKSSQAQKFFKSQIQFARRRVVPTKHLLVQCSGLIHGWMLGQSPHAFKQLKSMAVDAYPESGTRFSSEFMRRALQSTRLNITSLSIRYTPEQRRTGLGGGRPIIFRNVTHLCMNISAASMLWMSAELEFRMGEVSHVFISLTSVDVHPKNYTKYLNLPSLKYLVLGISSNMDLPDFENDVRREVPKDKWGQLTFLVLNSEGIPFNQDHFEWLELQWKQVEERKLKDPDGIAIVDEAI